jgi:hypothetical protein
MMFGNVFAEDVIWSEDFSSYAANAVPSSETYNYACVGTGTKVYTANLAGGTSPELLIGSKGGSFSATIPLNGKSGDMMLSYKANYDRITVTATTGATLGDKSNTGTSYSIPVTIAAGTESITLTFTNSASSNVRFDDVKLYQGTAKKPAGLSWGKASTTVTLGGDYSNIPTLKNDNNLSVICTSTEETVCTVTNAGVISVVGAGKTTITAEFAGNDEYEAQSVSIDITVNPAIDPDAKGQQNNPYLLTDSELETLLNSLEGTTKSGTVYVKGFITNIEEVEVVTYGNATFKIAAVKGNYDADIKLEAYRCNFLEKKKFTSTDQIKVDDEVVICGQLQWFGTGESRKPQIAQGCYIYSMNCETSGVNAIKANAKFEGKMYNVAGQVVNKGYKGLVIQDGRKFVNK